MENIIFERDYKEEKKKTLEEPTLSNQTFQAAIDTGFWKAYSELMDSIPKFVVPEDKAAYEDLLPRLDALAKKLNGYIRGEVRYDKWFSEITVILPFLEFCDEETYSLLHDLAFKTHRITISATEDGRVRINIMINYFREIYDPTEYVDKLIMENKELADLLSQVETKEEEKIDLLGKLLNPVLDYAQEVTDKTREELFEDLLEALSHYPDNLLAGIEEFLSSLS